MTPKRLVAESGKLSRRDFLATTASAAGGVLLASHVPLGRQAMAQAATPAVIDPNVFIRIAADGAVTVISKHFEMGQGVTTGLATLVAEELEADWSKVSFALAPANARLYANALFGIQGTGNSNAMANSWEQMRKVGAAARMMLAAAAAAKWNVPAAQIVASNSELTHRASGRRAGFGEFAEAAMRVPVPDYDDVDLKSPTEWKLIGKALPRLDSASKTTGTAMFSCDLRRPGALIAMVKRPPRFGATVVSFDAAEARKVAGVVDVVQVPSGIAVLANETWAAMRGRDALTVDWNDSKAERRSTGAMLREYRERAARPGAAALRRGDADAALERAASTIEADFAFPFLAHAPMEPLNGVIELRPDAAEIWAGSQLQTVDRLVAAQVLGLKPEQVKINTLLGGGSFGRRGNPVGDWIAELCSIAKAINARTPVHLVWTREDDIKGGFYRPLVLHRVKAGLTRDGRMSGWRHTVVCKSVFRGTPLEREAVTNGIDRSSVEGIVDTPYALGDFAVDLHDAPTEVPVLWWRSVGHSHTAHVMETMMDELAQAAAQDPLAFRLKLLGSNARHAAVLKLAAEKAEWGKPLPQGRGRGIACHHGFDTHIAMVAEVTAARGALKVDRIVAGVDCGIAVNPDNVAAQVEGAIGFALSTVLRDRITLNEGIVEQSNYDNYEPTRMREMPRVELHLVKSDRAPSGIGEPGVTTLAPAVGNAIFAATGARLRSLPFDLSAIG